jgi:hypothetical protein
MGKHNADVHQIYADQRKKDHQSRPSWRENMPLGIPKMAAVFLVRARMLKARAFGAALWETVITANTIFRNAF